MGKIILEFDSIEEKDDARMALDGVKWKVAMWELDQLLRSATKYGTFDGREATGAEQGMAEALREHIRDILRESNLNLEDQPVMNKWYNYGKWRHPKKRKELMKNMNKEQAKDELIKVLYSQVVDLTMMSKIELGDDVIAEIKRLKDIINE